MSPLPRTRQPDPFSMATAAALVGVSRMVWPAEEEQHRFHNQYWITTTFTMRFLYSAIISCHICVCIPIGPYSRGVHSTRRRSGQEDDQSFGRSVRGDAVVLFDWGADEHDFCTACIYSRAGPQHIFDHVVESPVHQSSK